MHKRKAEVISNESINGYPQNKKYKTNTNANSKQKTVSRASFVASLVGYDSKAKPTFLVGSKKVSLDFIKSEKPQPNPPPQAKYIDINPALVIANKNNQKNVTSKRAPQPRDVTVNAIKKHLQIKGTVQTAGTIQKLRKSLCDWDQTQRQPQNRPEDDIVSTPMLPPAPKQPRKPAVKRIEAFVYDSSPKQQQRHNVTYNNNDSFIDHNNESIDFDGNFDDKENEEENESGLLLDDFSSPFIYRSLAPSTNADQSANKDSNGSLNGSSDDIASSPFALTMSFNQTQMQMTQKSNANSKLKDSYDDSLNSSPFVYIPTQATPGLTPATFTQKKISTKGSRISQLMDSQKLSMSSPFIYVGTQQDDKLNNDGELNRSSNEDISKNYEDLTTQTESSENCSDNLNSSPFVYLTAPSTNFTQATQRSQRNGFKSAKQEQDNSVKNENSEPSQKSKLSQNSQSDLEFSCSPDLFATQHK